MRGISQAQVGTHHFFEKTVGNNKIQFGIRQFMYSFPGCGQITMYLAYLEFPRNKVYLEAIPEYTEIEPKTPDELIRGLVIEREF